MKPSFRFMGFTWLVPIVWGLECSDNAYPLGEWKCCRKCPPGSGLEKRCTTSSDTNCEPCEEGYYNDIYTYSRCKRCTGCDNAKGLQEVKSCGKYSDVHCACLPGYSEASRTNERRCDPCPKGFFSKGGTDRCQPWSNCTAEGKKTLRPGTREEDAICGNQSSMPERSTTSSLPFSPTQEKVTPTTKPRPTHASLTTRPKEHEPRDSDPGFVVIFTVGAVLLLVTGGTTLLLFFRKARKQRRQMEIAGVLPRVPHEDGRSSYRIPIQEEQTDCKSSLVGN